MTHPRATSGTARPAHAACLLDVYETVLTFDAGPHFEVLASLAGVDPRDLGKALSPWQRAVNDGSATVRTALGEALGACGRPPDDDLLDRLVAEDRRLMRDRVVVPDDVVPFLERLRARDVRTAFVSNCADNTRPMLDALGLSDLVEELVLSCEVGSAKPGAAIYEVALGALGVDPTEAVFVDDQRAFCAGAAALGIRAVHIDRTGGTGEVASLDEVDDLWPGLAT